MFSHILYRRATISGNEFDLLPTAAVKRLAQAKVAVLGARYGDLAIERGMLDPLGVDLFESRGATEDEIVSSFFKWTTLLLRPLTQA